MDWYDTLLYLHVLAAFILVSAAVSGWAMYIATGGGSRPSPVLRMAPLGGLLGVVGSLGVVIFGVWLAIYVKGYEVWDGWVLGAIVLWAIGSYAGSTIGRKYEGLRAGTSEAPSLALHVVLTASILLLLIDMLWKPGA
jgi:hypothetical protein